MTTASLTGGFLRYYTYIRNETTMSVNLEVKGTLAKLLATEDLIVEHRSVSTASFNVNTRVLTLPKWERASSTVFNLLISHEVGHALFTPNEDWRDKVKVPMGFVNVTEDVRIENLMKNRYSGLPKTFFRGYQELHDKDFFDLEDVDVSEMNIADRVNLHFKIGNFVQVPFTDEEMVVVNQCNAARTFQEALDAAEALYALHQQQKEDQKQSSDEDISASPDSSQQPQGGEGETPEDEGKEEQSDEEMEEGNERKADTDNEGDEETEEGTEQSEVEESKGGGGTSAELTDEVKTVDSLSDSLESLATSSSFNDPEYYQYPKVSLDDVVVSNRDVHVYINASFNSQIAYFKDLNEHSAEIIERAFTVHTDKFAKFKREIQSEVNYMVKEFECKKSATAYARATTSRTGVLDCTKLHTYKYTEDIFKKITNLPEGKNHGLVFVLDWSGSMCDILEDTMKQLLSLIMFCDKVNIPFDVYAFTNEWRRRDSDYKTTEPETAGELYIGEEFSLMNILTSTVNRKELGRQMETMYTIASSYSSRSFDIVPSRVGLSGTPLNEALISLRAVLPEFKTRNNVEKAHVMVLTDGESAPCRATKETTDYLGKSKIIAGRLYMGGGAYIRNRKTGTVSKVGKNSLTKVVLSDLRVEFPESTFTGFRILESRGGWFVRQAVEYDEKQLSKWKKEKSIALTNQGYNKYYIVSATSLQESSEFDVADDASKAKIKSAFAKSLKGKKNNKKILGDFISLIA